MKEILSKHKKIALQLSGGKDSVVCLYLLKDYLDQITVYHLNTGDQPKETQDIMDELKKFIPHYVEVKTDSREWISKNGYPSDVVPTSSTVIGRRDSVGGMALIDRFDCCFNNLMKPLHDKIIEDGITLIIRGQKLCDSIKGPLVTGSIVNGIEYLYPIQEWSHDDVYKYLKEVNAPIHPVYDKINDGIECLHCTGWWESKHLDWLEGTYPDIAKWVKIKHIEIKIAVMKQMNNM